MPEYWKDGIMESWMIGKLDLWNNGIVGE